MTQSVRDLAGYRRFSPSVTFGATGLNYFEATLKELQQFVKSQGFDAVEVKEKPIFALGVGPYKPPARSIQVIAGNLNQAEQLEQKLKSMPDLMNTTIQPANPETIKLIQELKTYLSSKEGIQPIIRFCPDQIAPETNPIYITDAKLPPNGSTYNSHLRKHLKALPGCEELNPQDYSYWQYRYKDHTLLIHMVSGLPYANYYLKGYNVTLEVDYRA